MGKGSGRYKDRQQVDDATMSTNWERIFGTTKPKKDEKSEDTCTTQQSS